MEKRAAASCRGFLIFDSGDALCHGDRAYQQCINASTTIDIWATLLAVVDAKVDVRMALAQYAPRVA
jgi:hypothetical protein